MRGAPSNGRPLYVATCPAGDDISLSSKESGESWIKAMGSNQAHVCMEATGRHSLGVALALHDAGHVVSVVNPAQIREFARTKLAATRPTRSMPS